MTPDKPTIFDVLEMVQTKNPMAFHALAPDVRRSFHPVVLLKWLAGCKSEDQLIALNDIANTKAFHLGAHPDIMIDLLSVGTTGRRCRHNWVKRPTERSARSDVLSQYFGPLTVPHEISDDEVERICREMGLQDKEIATILRKK